MPCPCVPEGLSEADIKAIVLQCIADAGDTDTTYLFDDANPNPDGSINLVDSNGAIIGPVCPVCMSFVDNGDGSGTISDPNGATCAVPLQLFKNCEGAFAKGDVIDIVSSQCAGFGVTNVIASSIDFGAGGNFGDTFADATAVRTWTNERPCPVHVKATSILVHGQVVLVSDGSVNSSILHGLVGTWSLSSGAGGNITAPSVHHDRWTISNEPAGNTYYYDTGPYRVDAFILVPPGDTLTVETTGLASTPGTEITTASVGTAAQSPFGVSGVQAPWYASQIEGISAVSETDGVNN